MTNSQNKKNKKQKDLCITSQQLTEQLATESLPEYTEFYVRKKDGSTDTQTWLNRRYSSAVEWWNTFNITEVLAPVPSYDEWKASEKYIKSLEEKIKIYERIDKQHKNDSIAYNELAEENQKLKDLLKECREEIEKHIPKKWHGEKDETMQKYRNKRELRTKIDEVLK